MTGTGTARCTCTPNIKMSDNPRLCAAARLPCRAAAARSVAVGSSLRSRCRRFRLVSSAAACGSAAMTNRSTLEPRLLLPPVLNVRSRLGYKCAADRPNDEGILGGMLAPALRSSRPPPRAHAPTRSVVPTTYRIGCSSLRLGRARECRCAVSASIAGRPRAGAYCIEALRPGASVRRDSDVLLPSVVMCLFLIFFLKILPCIV